MRRFETHPGRIISALFVGGLVGAMLTSAAVALIGAIPILAEGQFSAIGLALGFGLMIAPCSLLIWMVGLLAVGGPFWAVLHFLDVRSPLAGAALGATLTFAAVAALSLYVTGVDGRSSSLPWLIAAGMAAIGAVVGRLVARAAYEGVR
ncbi:hypothetical protein DDF62_18635 [Caulobacter radicis]|uniref:hypothetical protein n=1 Tax=Caulobacter radicis TaxID=2172650 RepID=UPI000D575E8A|nr:hypothetical protein [Caulobacter radicis]PVM86181.1 hypothetical protein DDF62_18635 [Caulobacter radicis]